MLSLEDSKAHWRWVRDKYYRREPASRSKISTDSRQYAQAIKALAAGLARDSGVGEGEVTAGGRDGRADGLPHSGEVRGELGLKSGSRIGTP